MYRHKLLRAWWPAGVWIGIIACESTDYMSSEHTEGMLYALARWVLGEINLRDFMVWHHYMRKAGHVIGYAMLCLLLYRAFSMTFEKVRGWAWRSALLAWLGTVLVATLDEWHQSYIPSRTGTPWDILLDSTAGLTFLLIAYAWVRRSSRTIEQSA